MLTYIEPDCRVRMVWGSFAKYELWLYSITTWEHADGTRTPVNEDERVEITHRVVRSMQHEGIRLIPK
jgi:hypothetical protein